MLWAVINQRPDAAPILFPQESSAVLTPEVNTSNKTGSIDHSWKWSVQSETFSKLQKNDLFQTACLCDVFVRRAFLTASTGRPWLTLVMMMMMNAPWKIRAVSQDTFVASFKMVYFLHAMIDACTVCFKCNAFTCSHDPLIYPSRRTSVCYELQCSLQLQIWVLSFSPYQTHYIDLCSVFNPDPNALGFSHASSQYLTQEL